MIDIIHDLRANSSTLAKEQILNIHKNNVDWTNYLIRVYNPFIKFNKTGDKNDLSRKSKRLQKNKARLNS